MNVANERPADVARASRRSTTIGIACSTAICVPVLRPSRALARSGGPSVALCVLAGGSVCAERLSGWWVVCDALTSLRLSSGDRPGGQQYYW
eukprot:COSAG02_NODE_1400_length_12844_cov_5.256493_13_plen_92_part_00